MQYQSFPLLFALCGFYLCWLVSSLSGLMKLSCFMFMFRAWGGFCLVERFTSSTTSGGNLSSSSESRTLSYPTLWRLTGWETPADTDNTSNTAVRDTFTSTSVILLLLLHIRLILLLKLITGFHYRDNCLYTVWVVASHLVRCVCFRAGLGPFRWSSRLVSLNTCCSTVRAAQTAGRCTGEDTLGVILHYMILFDTSRVKMILPPVNKMMSHDGKHTCNVRWYDRLQVKNDHRASSTLLTDPTNIKGSFSFITTYFCRSFHHFRQ